MSKNLKALILAAGYGTRLYPITKDTPKPLLLIQGRPIINHLLEKIEEVDSIQDVFVVTNGKFYPHFVEWQNSLKGKFKGLRLKIINDGSTSPDDRKGAMGDVGFVVVNESIKDDILIIGGDNLFDQGLNDYLGFSIKCNHKATIGLFDIKDKKEASKFGVVGLSKEGKVISFEEKPPKPNYSLIAMCLYYFSYEAFDLIFKYLDETHNRDTTGDFINWLHNKIPVYGFIFKGKWDDIGHIDSLCNWEEDYCRFKKEGA